jgi:metal-sulfur cluster biosynthetic enzyme
VGGGVNEPGSPRLDFGVGAAYGVSAVRFVIVAALVLVAVVLWRRARRRREDARRARVARAAAPASPAAAADEDSLATSGDPPPSAPVVAFRGGPVTEAQVVAALRECFDPEIPIDIYELGLVYGVEIDPEAIAVRMTLTSRDCPSARTIPEDVKQRIAALGQPNVRVEVVWDPPWHPSRISAAGKQRLGLG